jgi:hypothetical protein
VQPILKANEAEAQRRLKERADDVCDPNLDTGVAGADFSLPRLVS